MTTHAEFNDQTPGSKVAEAFAAQIAGKHVLITGVGHKSLGETLVLNIAPHRPSLVTITGRSKEKVESAAGEIKAKFPDLHLRTVVFDLASLRSVRAGAAEINSHPEPIDILINNAGVLGIPEHKLTEDGFELTLASNHLGHFLLTSLILGKLKAAAQKNPHGATRILNISSVGHSISPFRFSDYNFTGAHLVDETSSLPEDEKPNIPFLHAFQMPETEAYGVGWTAYGQSKTANNLFSVSLTHHLEKYGILSYSVHPGSILESALWRHLTADYLPIFSAGLDGAKMFKKNLDQGTSTTLVAAFDPKIDGKGNLYFDDCQLKTPAAPYSVDPLTAEKLWKLSETLVGEKFSL